MRKITLGAAGLAATGVLLAGCGSSGGSSTAQGAATTPTTSMSMPAATGSAAGVTSNPAADLRTKLDTLLGEHIFLATKATGAALGGRSAEFTAYGNLLATNGTDIGAMIGAAYGTDAQNTFNQVWSAHDGFFVDYTKAVAAKDAAGKQAAVANLKTKYIAPFSQFLSGATGLPVDAVTSLVTDHVMQTAAVVDAQGAKDYKTAYAGIRMAYAHMFKIGDALAPAIASKTGKFPGDSGNKAVGLRVALDQLLQEHLYLASDATGAALGGRSDEFTAAAGALNTNGTDIGGAIGGLFGTDAQNAFNKIWSAHNGFFVDYTTAVAKKDDAAKAKAVDNLTNQYVPQFSQFLAGPTGIDAGTLSKLVAEHVTTTAAIVDAQATNSYPDAAQKDRMAAMHMSIIGDGLAAGIASANPKLVQ
jgi:hypothetical protein